MKTEMILLVAALGLGAFFVARAMSGGGSSKSTARAPGGLDFNLGLGFTKS